MTFFAPDFRTRLDLTSEITFPLTYRKVNMLCEALTTIFDLINGTSVYL